jgi:shikimate kinase
VAQAGAVRHVVLVGLMGSGKTTVGRLVAARLGWPLRDSDAEIEAREGRTVRELDDALGTNAMHALEAEVLLAGLASPQPSVVCAAASVVDDERCLAALRDPTLLVTWLKISPETATARFASSGHRPRFGDDPAQFLAQQAAKRDPRFGSVATLELGADGVAPDELAASVVEEVRARS